MRGERLQALLGIASRWPHLVCRRQRRATRYGHKSMLEVLEQPWAGANVSSAAHLSNRTREVQPERRLQRLFGESRSAARKVMVFQWPCGTCAFSRSFRGPQPRKGSILVFTHVSSMKTRRLRSTLT
jgi:hypothetical protein